MATEIRTDRLHLGPWRVTDLDDYSALVREGDPRTAAAARDAQLSREELLARIHRQQASIAGSGIGLLVIRMNEDFAGYCGLVVGQASLEEPELAFELLAAYQGQGIATEAAAATVTEAQATGRRRLWATVRSWNDASFRVVDKVGFERTQRITTDDLGDSIWCTRLL